MPSFTSGHIKIRTEELCGRPVGPPGHLNLGADLFWNVQALLSLLEAGNQS